MTSQSERILHALQSGDRLTPMQAIQRFGCMRLAARIWDLKRDGHDIQERLVAVDTRDGTTEVAEYSMAPARELFDGRNGCRASA